MPARTTAPRSLISPTWDLALIGGGSIVLWALMNVMLRNDAPDSRLQWFVFNLSFLVNFPHFLVSYQLLYGDFGSRIFTQARFFWAGVVVPALLAGTLAYGFSAKSPAVLGYLVNSLYFFVGWHYVKQIFGGIAVTNANQGYFFRRDERALLKWNLFSLWAISFVTPNLVPASYQQDGIPYASLELPAWSLPAAYASLLASFGVLGAAVVRKYVREGRWPAPAAMACFAALYAWYLPALEHPMFMHTIPFFHSLQYLTFVYVFRRNKVEALTSNDETPAGRQRKFLGLYGYLGLSALTGGVFMYFFPRFLDGLMLYDRPEFGPTPAYFAFAIFINIHHYFIDNVIWRGSNPEMREYLFQPPGESRRG